jgi:carbamoyltransferase
MNKIISFWSGHDASFCVLENGIPVMHTEAERHTRIKEAPYDAIKLFFEHYNDTSNIVGLATCHRDTGIKEHLTTWKKVKDLAPLHVVGHHQAHAANAFYSSNFENATILTIDGGGIEDEQNFTVGASIWKGSGTKINLAQYLPLAQINIGGIWSRCTRSIFRYESGAPYGNAAGTVMALAALGKPDKYIDDFRKFLSSDLAAASARPPGHIPGISVKDPREPRHPFLGKWRDIADADEQEKFNMAAALQQATEEIIRSLIKHALASVPDTKNLCVVGGVALNSVAMGKIKSWFSHLDGIFIPPAPHDGGLTIGAAQYTWHHTMEKPRVIWVDNASPYLGKQYEHQDVQNAIEKFGASVTCNEANDDDVLEHLANGKIVSVFNGKAESGRRALGNRSILADPRDPEMKDKVNEKVKHRQTFRPFAPSVIREAVKDLFMSECDSPYMGFVLKFKDEIKDKLPAVVHFDGSARLQTVVENDNPWYYSFLKKWGKVSGYPVLLNTSFNDSTPICETPEHAMKCFLGTDIDYLYFPEYGIVVEKA